MLQGLSVAGLLALSSVLVPFPDADARTPPPSSAADLEAQALYNAGVERFEAREFEAALPPLEASLELLDDANTRYAYAQTLNKLGRCPEAVREYERILGGVPEDSDVRRVLQGAIRACAHQMAVALSEAEVPPREPAPSPGVLRLAAPKPLAVGDDPGVSWRRGGVAAMGVGAVSVVLGGTLAGFYLARREEFSSNLNNALARQKSACSDGLEDLECQQASTDIDTWRTNGQRAQRLAVVSGVVGLGLGSSMLLAGGLVFHEGKLRTRHWRNGRPSALFVPTPTGVAIVGRF